MTVLISDTFVGSDGDITGRTADTGQTWTGGLGTPFRIASNKLAPCVAAGECWNMITDAALTGNVKLRMVWETPASAGGHISFVVRAAGTGDFIIVECFTRDSGDAFGSYNRIGGVYDGTGMHGYYGGATTFPDSSTLDITLIYTGDEFLLYRGGDESTGDLIAHDHLHPTVFGQHDGDVGVGLRSYRGAGAGDEDGTSRITLFEASNFV